MIIESYFLTYYIDISKTIYVYYLNRSHNLLKKNVIKINVMNIVSDPISVCPME